VAIYLNNNIITLQLFNKRTAISVLRRCKGIVIYLLLSHDITCAVILSIFTDMLLYMTINLYAYALTVTHSMVVLMHACKGFVSDILP